jgi:hypothetical protein
MASIGNSPTQQAFTPAIDYFSGTGSATAFTLSRPVASVAQVQVVIDNVAQNPSSAFTVSSNTITFTSAPLSGTNNIYVYYTSPITQVIAPGQGTVTATSMASSTGTGAVVLATSPTITTPVISSLSSASATALTLQSAGTTAVTIDTSQNVGIGVTPSATNTGKAVEIGTVGNTLWGIGAADLQISAGTYYNGGNKYAVTGSAVSAYELVSGSHRWYYAASGTAGNTATFSESMRIDSSGNLLVGTTSQTPGYGNTNTGAQLSNNGSHFSRAATDWVMTVNQNTADGSARYLIGFRVSNGQVGNIQSNGTNCTYNSNSDYRLKENIAPMTGALAKVAQLKPVTYKWKVNGSDGEGFIAHELAEVVPECVTGDKDAVDAEGKPVYQGIDTSFLVATLTAALQELKAINDTQAETINALTARIEALENR